MIYKSKRNNSAKTRVIAITMNVNWQSNANNVEPSLSTYIQPITSNLIPSFLVHGRSCH